MPEITWHKAAPQSRSASRHSGLVLARRLGAGACSFPSAAQPLVTTAAPRVPTPAGRACPAPTAAFRTSSCPGKLTAWLKFAPNAPAGRRRAREALAEREVAGHEDYVCGYGDHASDHGDHASVFRDRFWLSLVFSMPVVFYSSMVQDWFGYSAPAFPGDGLVAPVLGTVVYLYGGWPFLAGALDEVRGRRPGMMLLIAMAITVAFASSWATSLGFFGLDFWWELAALVVIMLLGHWMEMRALGQVRGALSALAARLRAAAWAVVLADVQFQQGPARIAQTAQRAGRDWHVVLLMS